MKPSGSPSLSNHQWQERYLVQSMLMHCMKLYDRKFNMKTCAWGKVFPSQVLWPSFYLTAVNTVRHINNYLQYWVKWTAKQALSIRTRLLSLVRLMHIQAQATKDIALLPRIYLDWIEHIGPDSPFESQGATIIRGTWTRLGTRPELQYSSATIPSAAFLSPF